MAMQVTYPPAYVPIWGRDQIHEEVPWSYLPQGISTVFLPWRGHPPPLCTSDVFTCPRVTESLIYHWFLTSGVSDPELIRSRGQCCPMSSLPKWKCSVQQPLTTCGFWAFKMWLVQLKNWILKFHLINLNLNSYMQKLITIAVRAGLVFKARKA